jgi:glutaredoxin
VCENAEGLLNRRGVPFTTINVEDAKGAEQLKKLTGEQQAPVLVIGDKLIAKGFNEARWTAMLDEAGYPKSGPRRVAVKVPAESAPAAPPAAAPAALPVPGGGYPKQ